MEENKIETTEVEETKKGGKLKFVIMGLLALIVVAVVVIVVVKPFSKESKLKPNEIKIGDDVYTFSAENGIDNFDKVDKKDGEFSDQDYFVIQDNKLANVSFYVFDGMTYDGGTENYDKAESVGWHHRGAFVWGGDYFQYYTSEGIIDWDKVEEDYNKVIADETFKNLEYYEILLETCEAEANDFINADDVAGLEDFGQKSYADSKKYIMSILAHASLYNQLINGEIDYFVLASISSGQPVYMKVKIYSTEERVVSWGFE